MGLKKLGGGKNVNVWMVRRIKDLSFILFVGCLYYFLFNCIISLLQGTSFGEYIRQYANILVWKQFLVFNDNPFSGHLWYLSAVIYTLIVMLIIEKINCNKILMLFMPLLFAMFLFIPSNFCTAILGHQFSRYVVRNFIFIGVPYFILAKQIITKRNKLKTKVIVYILVMLLLSFLEFLVHYKIYIYRRLDDYYVTTIGLAFFLMIWATNNTWKVQKKCFSKLAIIGKKYSGIIYIIHPSIITAINMVVKSESIVWKCFIPFAAFLISLFLAAVIVKIRNRIKRNYLKWGC
nr:acyltransferase family protein [[Clostridium] scindens]